jgi:hypothetical protein
MLISVRARPLHHRACLINHDQLDGRGATHAVVSDSPILACQSPDPGKVGATLTRHETEAEGRLNGRRRRTLRELGGFSGRRRERRGLLADNFFGPRFEATVTPVRRQRARRPNVCFGEGPRVRTAKRTADGWHVDSNCFDEGVHGISGLGSGKCLQDTVNKLPKRGQQGGAYTPRPVGAKKPQCAGPMYGWTRSRPSIAQCWHWYRDPRRSLDETGSGAHPSMIQRGSSGSGMCSTHATSPRMDQYNIVAEAGCIGPQMVLRVNEETGTGRGGPVPDRGQSREDVIGCGRARLCKTAQPTRCSSSPPATAACAARLR